MTNKLHAMDHYSSWVRQKGSLPQFSTDRTEALHRIYKRLWRASNKGHESDQTVCMNEWRTIGMLIFNEELRQEAMKELRVVRGVEDEDDHLEEEALEPHIDDPTDARGYDRLYEWEMLLEEDELEFEYLSPDDETQDEISQRQRELHDIEGRKRKLCLGVRFTGARVKCSVHELEHAAENLGLVEKDFVQ